MVIDLDLGSEVTCAEVVSAARFVRGLLQALDLQSFVKTTGGRGLHIVIPLKARRDWSECLAFARTVAHNNRTNTSIAAYSTRARPDATASTPVACSELSAARPPARFTMRTVPARLRTLREDPWREYHGCARQIPRRATAALERL